MSSICTNFPDNAALFDNIIRPNRVVWCLPGSADGGCGLYVSITHASLRDPDLTMLAELHHLDFQQTLCVNGCSGATAKRY